MLVGINAVGMQPSWGGSQELYFQRVLAHFAGHQRSMSFVIFTEDEEKNPFKEFPAIQVKGATALEDAAAGENVDVLFTPLHNAPKSRKIPLILHVPDLWMLSSGGKRRLLGADPLREARRVANDAVACVAPSEFVRKELLEKLGLPLDRVVVAPYGVDEVFAETHSSVVEEPYMLVVGRTRPYKNLDRFLEAFERGTASSPHTLVVVGRPYEDEPESWGDRCIRIERVPRMHLSGLYQNSTLYICPSIYEGSGLSVLEAMRSGALVATGRIGGITEVAGDTPIFFNPESVDSMVGILKRAVEMDDQERTRRIHFGRQQAAEYTWESCASQTLTALRRV